MDVATLLLPDPCRLRLQSLSLDDTAHILTLQATSMQSRALCPRCGAASVRVHRRYVRTLADLPWADWAVRLQLSVRTFRCLSTACPQRMFAERLPTVATAWARRTARCTDTLRAIGFALGGRAGARLAERLALTGQRDLLITLVRQTALPAPESPTVVGIDDWAWRKGQTYATIVVNLVTHRPLALLPDREAATVAAWLRAHPTVHTVSRDRWNGYAEGITAGAPTATQVADRFHVLKNLGDLVMRVLQSHQTAIEQQWSQAVVGEVPPVPSPLVPEARTETEREQIRRTRIEQAHQLYHADWSQRAIAAHLGRHPKTIRRWLRLDLQAIGSLTRRRRHRLLDPYQPSIIDRWNAGCRNAVQLLRELQPQGYRGPLTILRSYLAHLRRAQGLPPRVRCIPAGATQLSVRPPCPSLRTSAALCVKPATALGSEDHRALAAAHAAHPTVAHVVTLAQAFAALVRNRQEDTLDGWLDQAEHSGNTAMKHVAAGVRQDEAAIRNALRLPYSNGPVEGTINRLKLLKRQGYGHLDLLERRLLAG